MPVLILGGGCFGGSTSYIARVQGEKVSVGKASLWPSIVFFLKIVYGRMECRFGDLQNPPKFLLF